MIEPIKIANREIGIYTIMAAIGFAASMIFITRVLKKKTKDDTNYIIIYLLSIIGLLIGGHLLYAITNMHFIINVIKNAGSIDSFHKLFHVLGTIFGGNVFYGGLIGGLITGMLLTKKFKVDKALLADVTAMVIPLFHGFGRIGCFLAGCCYGIESKIGFVYHHSENALANGVSRFPIQLVESGCNFILFFILYRLYKKDNHKGYLLHIYFYAYPAIRFIDEFFRGDSYRGFLFGLSTSQIISILLIIINTVVLLKRKKKVTTK